MLPEGGSEASLKPTKSGKPSARTCIVSREEHAPEDMIRFVRGPGQEIVADFAAKLPGRGAWVSADRDLVLKALDTNLFSRAFKAQVSLPAGLNSEGFIAFMAANLEKRLLDAIGLARRAGDAMSGFDQVHSAIKAGKAGVLISAGDAAADGADKLSKLAGHMATPAFRVFDTERLSAALGGEGVRHVSIRRGPHAERFLRDARRLAGFAPGFCVAPAAEIAATT